MDTIRSHLGKLLLVALLCLAVLPQLPIAQATPPDPPPTLLLDLRNLPVTGGAAINTSTIVYVAPGGRTGSTALRIKITLVGTDSVFSIDHGDDLDPSKFNTGTALTAGCEYTFTTSITDQDAVTFVLTTSTTIGRIVVERIAGGVL